MRRIILLFAVSALFASCSKVESPCCGKTDDGSVSYANTIVLRWEPLTDEDGTKTNVSYSGNDVDWNSNDTLGVWPLALNSGLESQQLPFRVMESTIDNKSIKTGSQATFDGAGWALICDGSHKYSAYYPYRPSYSSTCATLTYPEVLSYTSSISTTDATKSAIGRYMYMYASPVRPDGPDDVTFYFRHFSALADVKFSIPDTDKGRRPMNMILSADDSVFVLSATYNPSDTSGSIPALTPVSRTDRLTVRVGVNNQGNPTSSSTLVHFPIPMFPAALAGHTLKVEVECNDGVIYDGVKVCTKDQTSGSRYGYTVTSVKEREIKSSPEAVDLGLSVKWSSLNLGATVPEEFGFRTAWGMLTGKIQPENNTWGRYTHGQYTPKSINNPNGTPDTSNSSSWYGITKYNAHDTLTVLQPGDDAASVLWGDGWRMPTCSEFRELLNGTMVDRSEMTVYNGVEGFWFSNKNDSSKKIFMPAYIYYWTSTVVEYPVTGYNYSTHRAWCSLMSQASPQMFNGYPRTYLALIRPVKDY